MAINMNRTFLLDKVYDEMSCFSLVQVDFRHRCGLATSLGDCQHIANFFNYFTLMYCYVGIRSRTKEALILCVFITIAILLMCMVYHIISKYFSAILMIMSVKLNLSEYVAGATLMSFGNSIADLFVNLMPIRGGAPLFTIAISNSIAVILISGGVICFLRPFKIYGHCAVRDLLFLMLFAQLLTYMMLTEKNMRQREAISLMVLYFIYFCVVATDLTLVWLTIRSLKAQISKLQNSYRAEDKHHLRVKEAQLFALEKDNLIVIHKRGSYSSTYKTKAGNDILSGSYNIKKARDMLHNPDNPRNLFLFTEFFQSLSPFDEEDWSTSSVWRRIYLIAISPIVMICSIFIPRIDYERPKHGWSKLLNCSQIISNPIMLITLTEAFFVKRFEKWHVVLDFHYSKWSLCATVPLAIFVFIWTRTDRPPRYHLFYLILTGWSCILLIAICATELEILSIITGLLLNLTESFVASVIRSTASAISDLIMNVDMALQGYERMAFAATMAGPIFSITVCVGVPLYFNEHAHIRGAFHWLTGEHGVNSYIFLHLIIWAFFVMIFTYNFVARRSAGVFLFIMYFLFVLYGVLVEWECIHEFSDDIHFELE